MNGLNGLYNIIKPNRKYFKMFFLLFVSIVFLITQDNPPKRTNLIKKIGIRLMAPTQKFAIRIETGVKEIYKDIIELGALRNENLKLKKERDLYKQKEFLFNEFIHENKRLRKILDFKSRNNYVFLSADVIAKDPTNWFATILINRGADDGIKENMVAITPLGVVGKIIEVTKHVSRVQLVLDINSNVAAMDEQTRAIGILRGLSKKNCLLDYIDSNYDIKTGDTIITSGLGGIFPKGIPIGKVSKVEKKSSELFQIIEIIPDVNFYNLEEVMIIKEPYILAYTND